MHFKAVFLWKICKETFCGRTVLFDFVYGILILRQVNKIGTGKIKQRRNYTNL